MSSNADGVRVVIYHHPGCGTSQEVLALIRARGIEPIVIEYLETGWTRPQLLGLFAAAGLSAHQALRAKNSPAEALGLLEAGITEDELIDAMVKEPILVNRPFVCTPKGVRLTRPVAVLSDLL